MSFDGFIDGDEVLNKLVYHVDVFEGNCNLSLELEQHEFSLVLIKVHHVAISTLLVHFLK